MGLRPELMPAYRDLAKHRELVTRAFEALDAGRAPEAELAAIEEASGRPVSAGELEAWHGSEDAATVAATLALPDRLGGQALTREELVEIVRRLMPADDLFDAENEPYWIALFEANVPRPNAANLVYYPPDSRAADAEWDPTPDEIVDAALSYRPIQL